MPTNFYFQSGESIGAIGEQRLFEDLIIESIQIYGQDVWYLPRISFREDTILGEDPLNYFDQAYPIEMYLQNVQGWEGNHELFSKFGLSVNDQATFVVAKRRWEDVIKTQMNKTPLPKRPLENDLIYFPKTKALFQIKYVQHLEPFFQLGKFYIYSLQCELYHYSAERLQTGVQEIDDKQTTFTHTVIDEINFADNETIEEAGEPLFDFSELNPFGEVQRDGS